VRYGELNEIWFTTNDRKSAPTEKLAMTTRTGRGSGIWYVERYPPTYALSTIAFARTNSYQ